jgi:acyl-CoA thioesterase I
LGVFKDLNDAIYQFWMRCGTRLWVNAALTFVFTFGASSINAQTVLVLGDSLSAEYGLKRGTGWVALAQLRTANSQTQVKWVNASISGETTSGGLARLPALLKQHQPNVVVLELGANDALRGLALAATDSNLNKIAQASKIAGAKLLIIGIRLPPNYGKRYNDTLLATYASLAKNYQAGLVPFMLEKLGVTEAYFQADRTHPTEAAQPLILETIWPELSKLLKG